MTLELEKKESSMKVVYDMAKQLHIGGGEIK
jgi:hypothetical protein